MKKRIITLLVVLCTTCSISFASSIDDKIENKSQPPRAVNDFANVIDDALQAKIESTINAYWKDHTIAICVVTVPTLQGYEVSAYSLALFNKWGIGELDDRGVLLFMAPNERTKWITVGRGLEGSLTDAQAGQIGRSLNRMFREGKWGEGAESGVNKLIAHFSTISQADHKAAANIRKSEHARDSQESMDSVSDIFTGLAFFALLVLIILILIKAQKRKKLLTEAKELIKTLKVKIVKTTELVENAVDDLKDEANWARTYAAKYGTHCLQILTKIDLTLDKCQALIEHKDVEACKEVTRCVSLVNKTFEQFTDSIEDLKKKIKKIETETPARLAETKKTLHQNAKKIIDYISRGYQFESFKQSHTEIEERLNSYGDRIADKDLLEIIYNECISTEQRSGGLLESAEAIVSQKITIDAGINNVTAQAQALYTKWQEGVESVAHCKNKYPAHVWQSVDTRLQKVIKLSPENLKGFKAEIKKFNGDLQSQSLILAKTKYTELTSLIAEINQIYDDIQNIASKQEANHGEYIEYYNQASAVVNECLTKTTDSDVYTATRNNAGEVSKRLISLHTETRKNLVDWVDTVDKIKKIKVDAEAILKKAKDEINAAVTKRKNDVEEDDDDGPAVFASVSNNVFESKDDDDGFRGFNGGESNGGGAGGDIDIGGDD
jgi:uncharacterized protein